MRPRVYSGVMKPGTHLGKMLARSRCRMIKQGRVFSAEFGGEAADLVLK